MGKRLFLLTFLPKNDKIPILKSGENNEKTIIYFIMLNGGFFGGGM